MQQHLQSWRVGRLWLDRGELASLRRRTPLHRYVYCHSSRRIAAARRAIARSARSGRYYAVQMFGRPETLSVRFALSNGSAATVHYAVDGQHHALTRGATRWHRHCLPPTVNLTLSGKATPLALRPADGAHYRIGAAGQALHMIGNGARPAVPRRSRNSGVHGVAADR